MAVFGPLVVVLHRDPDVGDHAVCAAQRFGHIRGDQDPDPFAGGPVEHVLRRRERFGAGQPQLEAEADSRLNPGRRHVVAVAAPGDGAPRDGAQMLFEGHHVAHQLAGMGAVGEAVDDRHRGVFGKLQQMRLLDRADHDGVHIARQHARRVGHGLAAPELGAAGLQHHRVAAELANSDLEGDPGPGRGLLEDQRQRLAGQRLRLAARRRARLERPPHVENFPEGVALEAVEIEEMLGSRHVSWTYLVARPVCRTRAREYRRLPPRGFRR